MGIETYSTTPNANTALAPENMQPGGVNDAIRQVQADVRAFYNEPEWRQYGSGDGTPEPTFVNSTTFRITGVDVTAVYMAGRRVRVTGSGTGTIHGSIASSSFGGGNTDVVCSFDSGSMSNETLTVEIGLTASADTPLPKASTTLAGIVERATEAEFLTGIDDARFLTAALFTSGATIESVAPALDIPLPGGWRLQAGLGVGGSAVEFTTPFTTWCAVVPCANPSNTAVRWVTITNKSLNGFTIEARTEATNDGTPSTVAVGWIAVGI